MPKIPTFDEFQPTNESSQDPRRRTFVDGLAKSKAKVEEWKGLERTAVGLGKKAKRMASSGKTHGEWAAEYDGAVAGAESAARDAERAQKALIAALGGDRAKSWHGQQFWFQDLWAELVDEESVNESRTDGVMAAAQRLIDSLEARPSKQQDRMDILAMARGIRSAKGDHSADDSARERSAMAIASRARSAMSLSDEELRLVKELVDAMAQLLAPGKERTRISKLIDRIA